MTDLAAPRDTLAVRQNPWLLIMLLSPSLGLAQSVPSEALRAGPTPQRVDGHGVVAFVREFAAARSGDVLRIVYTENGRAGRATLRSASLRFDAGVMVRAREDVTLAEDARTIALAYSGERGAAVYVIPRRPPPPLAPGARRPSRAPVVGVPASTRDPLGPSNLSGGDVVVQRLDGEGRAVGAPVTLFTENARLTRLSAAWVGERLLVAWTGGAVTDDEVRVTVRARSMGADGSLGRGVATHSGLLGDIGDVLEVTPEAEGGASLWVSAALCGATEAAPPPLVPPLDPSANIEPPRRVLMPQQPMHDAPGPTISCDPFELHRVALDARDEVRSRSRVTLLARDLAARAGDRWAVAVNGPQGVVLAWATPLAGGATLRSLGGAAVPTSAPTLPAQDLTLRARAEAEPAVVEAPVPPADRARFEVGEVALLSASARGALVTVASGRRVLHLVGPDGQARELARSTRGVAAIRVLDGDAPWLLAREGQWSGALRWAPLGEGAVVTWPPTSPVSPQPVALQGVPAHGRFVWDEAFGRLWARARTARAVFMRHENTAGALAARPEAPTDPRMPGVIAMRNRHRGRWESVCSQLRARASQLARSGAGQDVVQGVNALCEIHPDLQLGVPVNPAL